VTLDTRDFILRSQQAEAARDGAKVQLDAAKLDWDRLKSLLAEKAVPQSQFDMVDGPLQGRQGRPGRCRDRGGHGQEGLKRLGDTRTI